MKSLVMAWLIVTSTAFAIDKSPFKVSTFKQSAESQMTLTTYPKSDRDVLFDPSLAGYASTTQYTGESRVAPVEKLDFVEKYFKVLGRSGLEKIYKKEIKVNEGGVDYWILVQNNVFPYLDKELKKGSNFKIFYRVAGVAKKKQIIFLMMDFEVEKDKS